MQIASPRAFRVSAAVGLLGVALGAFGAHWLRDTLAQTPKAPEWWEKAVFYHFIHGLVMLLLSCLRPFPALAWSLFGIGIAGFSGSLYLLALTGMHWLVFVTPLGGVSLLAAWVVLLLRPPIDLPPRPIPDP